MPKPLAPDIPYEIVTLQEPVGDRVYTLEALVGFEATMASMYRALGKGVDLKTRQDLSPMFGVIWGSARAITTRLDALGDALRGTTVLEVACGLALPSMVAADQGADVLATDLHPHTERFLLPNLARNGTTGVRYQTWDGRTDPSLGRFDRVIATDVLFASDNPAWVARAFALHLAPQGVGWLADPGRSWLHEFTEAAAALGLVVTDEVDRVSHPGGTDDIFVLTLRWP